MTRDIEGDYRRAYIHEYEGYNATGRAKDAAAVAKILKDHYGHDVKHDMERADAEAPEDAAEPGPKKRGGRPKLPRDEHGNIVR